MKKLVFSVFAMCVMFFAGCGDDDTEIENGTERHPFVINTAAQLLQLAEEVNGGDKKEGVYYKLGGDIDLSQYDENYNDGKGWQPIWDFRGVFDGKGKKIRGLYINNSADGCGLFGAVQNGKVKNLGLEDVNIKGSWYVGAVVGWLAGIYSGDNIVENCYSTGKISGFDYVGGVVGRVQTGRVKNCYSTCEVSGSVRSGGVVGTITGGRIVNCYSTGVVNGGNNSVGGIVDVLGGNSSMSRCAALNPSVSGDENVGRVAGVTLSSLSGNIAWNGMEVIVVTSPKEDVGNTGWHIDGQGMDKAEISAPGFFKNLFTFDEGEKDPWTYDNTGKLPGLFGKVCEWEMFNYNDFF